MSAAFAISALNGALADAPARALRREIKELFATGSMKPNATHLVREGTTTLLEKRGIFEAEVKYQHAPRLPSITRNARTHSHALLPLLIIL